MKKLIANTVKLQAYFNFTFVLSIIACITLLFDYGFQKSLDIEINLVVFYQVTLSFGVIAFVLRLLRMAHKPKIPVFLFDIISTLYTLIIIVNQLVHLIGVLDYNFLHHDTWLSIAVLLMFIREFSEIRIQYKRTLLNPAQLFILSFLFIILIGALLLKLPLATSQGISFLDAIFTSTSAVCVTGLIVVDTATAFTQFGQTIIMILIQVGGLGILTFASYFSFFFKGKSSYENQLTLSEITNAKRLSEVFTTFKRIIIITFGIELIGAILIYFNLNAKDFIHVGDQLFFAVFHSISAFCNAGFSILSDGIADPQFKFNYGFQIILIGLFILGGLGFPIFSNIFNYTRRFVIRNLFFWRKNQLDNKPWVLNLNSRIILITTFFLIFFGTLLFLELEFDNTLAEHESLYGKFVTALFGATTPRTAGFNTFDFGDIRFPTFMLIMFLMWVGASPGSTGGGIKTTTLAVATLNLLSIAKGKSKIEIYRREISMRTVQRAFAVISLSLIMIGFGITMVSIFNPDLSLKEIAFECFSAFSTVGLTVGITTKLSSLSKVVIILLMFVGRVSMLSILIAIFKRTKHKNYRYPMEEISIN
ncbi:TrkH family potassium uptake protein [Lishizhenia sp.]|uniref:TrkH family potassium uptake protein n=1 Tax=Lishizhenia sp. TaxID=2497594 RepID=UPI00299E84FD|nr:potassium transporter TrkG [Lishizhenia sp.]MDX1446040.1 potassium transporter TrkG [Lishizhenia sp.]